MAECGEYGVELPLSKKFRVFIIYGTAYPYTSVEELK
jgi:hypothetical protein